MVCGLEMRRTDRKSQNMKEEFGITKFISKTISEQENTTFECQ